MPRVLRTQLVQLFLLNLLVQRCSWRVPGVLSPWRCCPLFLLQLALVFPFLLEFVEISSSQIKGGDVSVFEMHATLM